MVITSSVTATNLAHLSSIIKCVNIDNYKDYEKEFNSAVKKNSKDSNLYFLRACFYLSAGQYDLALNNFDLAKKVSKSMPEVFFYKAFVYAEIHKNEECLENIAALRQFGDSTPALFMAIGYYNFSHDSLQEALNNFLIAKKNCEKFRMNPQQVDFLNLLLGNVYTQLQDYKAAVDHYAKLLNGTQIFMNCNAGLFLDRARAYFQLNDTVDAMADIERAYYSFPERRLKGYIFAFKKERALVDELVEEMEKTIYDKPNEARKYYDFASYYSILNDKEKALKYLEKSLEMDTSRTTCWPVNSDFNNIGDTPEFKLLSEKYCHKD